jgi:hypothetical protein
LRVGIDLFKLTRGLYDEGYKGIELWVIIGWQKIFFGCWNWKWKQNHWWWPTQFYNKRLVSKGFDYNAYENWLDMENIISIGLRYGFSTFNQELNSYKIYNANPYFESLSHQERNLMT